MRSQKTSQRRPKRSPTHNPGSSRGKSNEPSTAGGRELRLKARPPARFNSLRSQEIVNQQQRPLGNTLLAQRCPLSGNSYFWHTARCRSKPRFVNRLRTDELTVSDTASSA